ncbi:MAG: sigma-70 family RNA polymerase sigma factor [Verrucomicrobiota bacterium]
MGDLSGPDQKDFDDLFSEYEVSFRAYARTLLPSWDAVSDVMQTASLVMWQKLESIDTAEGFHPWGKVVVRNTALNYLRSQSRDPLTFDPELVDFLIQESETKDEVELGKRQEALSKCLDALSNENRKLVLSPYREHGYLTKLAEESGRTRNSLYKQIRRIRARLEQCVLQHLSAQL